MKNAYELYHDRPMSAGYPEIEKLYHTQFVGHLAGKARDIPAETRNIMMLLGRAVDLSGARDVCVVGCEPRPETMQALVDMDHKVTGVEPIPSYVENANDFLSGSATIVEGVAERMPFDDNSFDLLLFESVLEHVDSPSLCLDELYRVLRPGGILYLTTTNRYRFRLSGENGVTWSNRLIPAS